MPARTTQGTLTHTGMRQRAVARSGARAGRPPCAAGGQAHAFFGRSERDVAARQSRDTHGGCERSQAVGEAGLTPASVLLDPASLQPIRVVSGGGGIRTPEGPNGPLRFSRPQAFSSTMLAEAR